MRGAALADLHLGFRQFSATENGRNAREQDVERAWLEAVRQVIEAKPDLVTIAGDNFHHLRVSDYARFVFLAGLKQILDGTSAIIIILQGNHEAARTVESLTPIALAEMLKGGRVHVVTEPKRIRFRVRGATPAGTDVSVACLPFTTRTAGTVYGLEPDPDADVNVLLVHAAVRGADEGDALPRFYVGDEALDVGRSAEKYDVVAAGDYHEFTRLHPTRLAFYSGSIERTSSNIWQETKPKGWVLYDTEAGTLEFKEVPTRLLRDYIYKDLARRDWPTDAKHVNECLQLLVGGEDSGAIVRLKVEDFPREERDKLDREIISQLQTNLLHFQLDLRLAPLPEAADLGDRRGRSASLSEIAAGFFEHDPDEVRGLAFRFLGVEAGVEEEEWAEA